MNIRSERARKREAAKKAAAEWVAGIETAQVLQEQYLEQLRPLVEGNLRLVAQNRLDKITAEREIAELTRKNKELQSSLAYANLLRSPAVAELNLAKLLENWLTLHAVTPRYSAKVVIAAEALKKKVLAETKKKK